MKGSLLWVLLSVITLFAGWSLQEQEYCSGQNTGMGHFVGQTSH
jgi:hypothetical protein